MDGDPLLAAVDRDAVDLTGDDGTTSKALGCLADQDCAP